MDGPSGSGKSTLARRIAGSLGYLFLDTGAMYRALSLGISRRGARDLFLEAAEDPSGLTEPLTRRLESVLEEIEVTLEPAGGVLLDGVAVGDEIRGPEMDRLVSPISVLPPVRRRMVDLQREARRSLTSAARYQGLVAEGRDMGSVVFPDATLKVFLDADPAERARRRQAQDRERGIDRDLATVEAEIRDRDRRDSERVASPLVCAADAVRIDTTGRTLAALEEHIKGLLTQRLAHLNETAS